MSQHLSYYLKIGDHNFYRIRKGEFLAVNTDTGMVKKLKSLPSGYCKDVTLIEQHEYDIALKHVLGDELKSNQ